MATSIKAKFRRSTVEGKAGTVYYQLIHNRRVARINTDVRLLPEDWHTLWKHDHEPDEMIRLTRKRLDREKMEIEAIIKDCENSPETYSLRKIVALYQSSRHVNRSMAFTPASISDTGANSFVTFMQSRIHALREEKREGTAANYHHALNSFMAFSAGRDITFEMITGTLMERYEAWLKNAGLKRNSTSFYMRILRAVYNRAVRRGLVRQSFPFRTIYTGSDTTKKRAVQLETIMALSNLDLTAETELRFAKDLFLFSFATCGMPFVDMAYLRKGNIRNGYIVYERHKTRESICIKVTPMVAGLLKTYERCDSSFIFPILTGHDPTVLYKQYRSALTAYNRRLRRISGMLPGHAGLTSYVARHSWATIARDQGFPASVIGKALGHTSERTTRTYLATISNEAVDTMNAKVLACFQDVPSL